MKTKDIEDLYDDIIAGNTDLDGFRVWLAGWSRFVGQTYIEHYEGNGDDNTVPGHRDRPST